MKGADGAGLITKERRWDDGSPAAFRGRNRPAPPGSLSDPDTDATQSAVATTHPPKTSVAGAMSMPVKNTQSAPAPRMGNPATLSLSGKNQGTNYHASGRTVGTDKGPRGSGKSGGPGVTKE